MATFFMFGKYTPESIKKISAERTQQAVNEIKKMGGEVSAMRAALRIRFAICVKLAVEVPSKHLWLWPN
jgi:uncharacterized protein with GYD domain